jgi:hypothetical protein
MIFTWRHNFFLSEDVNAVVMHAWVGLLLAYIDFHCFWHAEIIGMLSFVVYCNWSCAEAA